MERKIYTVKNFEMDFDENCIKLSCHIEDCRGEKHILWYHIFNIPKTFSINSADAFFAPCLVFALKHNADIRFDIPISENLALTCADIAFIFGTQLGLDRHPHIEMTNVVKIDRQAEGAVTGFPSGVDSWFSLKKHLLDCTYPSKRLTHLVFNDVGANSTGLKTREARARAQEVAQDYGLRLISVVSNMSSFLKMSFEQTHTARNASIAHLLTPVVDTFYYSSADTYLHAGVFPSKTSAHTDTIVLPLLSNDAIQLRSSGSLFTRGEKTKAILDIDRIGEQLDVCVRHERAGSKINCGRCWKCLRTALTLEAFGTLKQFEPVFDLDAYEKFKPFFTHGAAVSVDQLDREPFDLARKAGLVRPRFLYIPGGAAVSAARKLNSTSKISRIFRRKA